MPTDFFADMNMQFGTGSVIFQKPEGTVRPYGLVGAGIYYRPVKVTTPGVGYVPGYCDPWWYVCYPGGFVPVENIVGDRSSTDFGMAFGGGANFGPAFAELRVPLHLGTDHRIANGWPDHDRRTQGDRTVLAGDFRFSLLEAGFATCPCSEEEGRIMALRSGLVFW